MRLTLILSLAVLAGTAFAQDTSFPAGPQYLIPTGSQNLLQPIATPSMSLGSGLQDAYISPTELVPSRISVSQAAPPSLTFMSDVYWGEHTQSEALARRVVTPSLTAEETAFYTYATANLLSAVPEIASAHLAETQPESSVIEIRSANLSTPVPASLFDTGVTVAGDAQSLCEPECGVTLGEHAAYWKSHKRPAQRVFTNQDVRAQ